MTIFPSNGSNGNIKYDQQLALCMTCYLLCAVLSHSTCPTLFDPMDCSPPGSSVHGNSPGKNTAVGCHALLKGFVPTQGSNPGLQHCRWILSQLRHTCVKQRLCSVKESVSFFPVFSICSEHFSVPFSTLLKVWFCMLP